jgi:hypothetical protein
MFLISPLFFFFEIENQPNSHIEAKKKPKPMLLKKKWEPPNTGMDVSYGGAGSLAGKSDTQKKTYPLCTYPAGLGGLGWPYVNCEPSCFVHEDWLTTWTVNFHQWSLLRKQWQKCSQNRCVKNGPNLFCWLEIARKLYQKIKVLKSSAFWDFLVARIRPKFKKNLQVNYHMIQVCSQKLSYLSCS